MTIIRRYRKRWMRRFFLPFLLSFMVGAPLWSTANAKELIIGFAPEKPPFVFATSPFTDKYYNLDTKQLGIQIDVVIAALEGSGYTFKPVYASNQRIIQNVKQKAFDGGEMAGPRVKNIFYSATIIEFQNFAITRKSENLKIDRIRDLQHLSLVTWQGAHKELGDEFSKIATKSPLYYEHPSLKGQCMMFFGKRVQSIIIAKNIFLWWKKELSQSFNTSEDYIYHPIFPGVNRYTMGFSSETVRDIFDTGLKRIKENGKYEEIFQSYLGE